MVNNIVLSGMAWVSSIKNAITSRISEESGQDLIEYAVLVGGIGIVAAVAFLTLPIDFGTMKTKIADCITFNGNCGN